MKTQFLRIILLSAFTMFLLGVTFSVIGANRYSVAIGNWNATSTWAATSGGSSGVSIPVAGDIVYIQNGKNVTVTADAAAASVTFTGAAATLTINSGYTLAVNGAIILLHNTHNSTACLITGNGTLSCASVEAGSNLSLNINALSAIITSTISAFNISGNVTMIAKASGSYYGQAGFRVEDGITRVGGQITSSLGTSCTGALRMNGVTTGLQTGTLVLSGTPAWGTLAGITIVLNGTGATVEYNGSSSQTILGTTYTNLIINTGGTSTLGASATVNGTFYMTKGIFALGGFTLTWGTSSALVYNGTADQTTGFEWPVSFNKPVTISNTGGVVTISTAIFTGTSATTTINTGTTLATGAGTFTAAGPMAINGSFQLSQGSWATGNTWTYTSGTLVFNNSSGSFGVNSVDVFWPTTNGPTYVNVKGAGGITMNVARTVSGVFQTAAGVTNANNLTLNGTAQINTSGYLTGTPTYGASSVLVYNTTSYTTTTAEFPASGVKNVTITAPSGTNTVTLDGDKTISGTLAVGTHTLTGGKSMNASTIAIGTGSMVMGDITTSTALTCSGASSISLSGVWSVTGFTKSNSTITFTGTGNINNATSFYNVTNSGGTRSVLQNIDVENTLLVSGGDLRSSGTHSLTMSGAASTINITSGSISGTDVSSGNDLSLLVSGAQTTLTGNATTNDDHEKKFHDVTVNSGKKLILQRGILCRYGAFTCNGTIQIDANGYIQNTPASAIPPAYNATTGSLIFNNGGAFQSAAEWPATYSPFNVTLQNAGTNVTMGGSRFVAGTLTLSNGTLTVGANTLTFSGLSPVRTSGSIDASNGSAKLAFTNTSSITLPASIFTGNINNLTINGTGGVVLGSATTVAGTLNLTTGTLSGSLTYGANGILTYNGTAYSTTSDVEFPAASGPKDLNVTIANSSGLSLHANRSITGNLSIASGQKLIIPAPIQLTVGGNTVINQANGLIIRSAGSFLNTGTITGSGTAQVERLIDSDSKWHLISSPVSGQNICDGVFAASAFNSTTGVTYDFFKWSEPTVSGNLNWLNLKKTDWSLNSTDFGTTPQFASGMGYLVDYSSSFAGSTTKSFAGALNTGDKSVTLTFAGNTWNLIGNPFPSAINWDNVTKTVLNGGYYYIYSESKSGGAGYESYLDGSHKTAGTNGKISSMQGFFVKAAGSPLILPNTARVHDNNWLKNTESVPVNRLTLKMGNGVSYDEAFILFEATGSVSKGWYDADKLFSMNSEVPQVFTLKENDLKICISSLPILNGTMTIPVGMLIPADGNYSLQLSGLESFISVPGVLLEDLMTNTTQNLVQTPVYAFSATTTDNANRFLLHLNGSMGTCDKPGSRPFTVFASGNSLFVADNTGKNRGDVYVYNMMGQLIASTGLFGNSTCKLNLNVPVGYYLVKVITGEQASSSKVFVN